MRVSLNTGAVFTSENERRAPTCHSQFQRGFFRSSWESPSFSQHGKKNFDIPVLVIQFCWGFPTEITVLAICMHLFLLRQRIYQVTIMPSNITDGLSKLTYHTSGTTEPDTGGQSHGPAPPAMQPFSYTRLDNVCGLKGNKSVSLKLVAILGRIFLGKEEKKTYLLGHPICRLASIGPR